MSIHSAEVGYSSVYQPYAIPPVCDERTCTLSIYDTVSRLCNGRRSCSIDQNLLIQPNYGALCSQQRDANFIDVKFYCVSGIFLLIFVYADHA